MTHEYVIALNGRIGHGESEGDAATAIGWAAEAVLAVGADDDVRSISRGNSTFLDLGGCVVTALPSDPERAGRIVAEASEASDAASDVTALLIAAGLLDADSALTPGSPADLAFWDVGPWPDHLDQRVALGLIALVHEGAFTEGDEHYGPFPAAHSG